MATIHNEIKKAVIRSQHCQRNWDLTKSIPEEDIELLIHAATNCPSKQNVSYYNVHFITDRNIIKQVHEMTNGFIINSSGDTVTNSQTLANLLIIFTNKPQEYEDYLHRNSQIDALKENKASKQEHEEITRDKHMAIGIAAGYVNVIASMLGYSTGCCTCFYNDFNKIINTDDSVELIMGVGFSNSSLNRRIHHEVQNFVFPTKKKQEITVVRHS